MFESLTDRLSGAFRSLSGKAKLSEDNINDALKQVKRALLDADVALIVVTTFVDRVKQRALGQEVGKDLSPDQVFIKIVHEELVPLMGQANESLSLNVVPPAVVLMAGLQGSGKTTSVAKLAKRLKEIDKKKVMVVSADIYRPAAIKQLETLAETVGVNFFPSHEKQDPREIAKAALAQAKKEFFSSSFAFFQTALIIDLDFAVAGLRRDKFCPCANL